MSRKTAGTLDQQRQAIARKYTRGRKTSRTVGSKTLSPVELATKKEAACFLRAADYSYAYIAESLNTTQGIVRSWFEEEKMVQRTAEIQSDFVDGAVTLLKTYAVELIEMLVEIARTTEDDKIAIQAITECLDRMGLSKVNKSESAVTNTSKQQIDLTDTTGLLESMKDAPPEIQQQMAMKMEEALALASEHTDRDVTHA